MARIRTIKPSFFTDEDLATVSRDARLLAVALFTMADRAGRLEDKPKTIKLGAFPWDEVDVDLLLCELGSIGFIVRYDVAGKKYIQIRTFEKHQRFSGKEADAMSDFPAPGSNGEAPGKHPGSQERKGKEGKGVEEVVAHEREDDPTNDPPPVEGIPKGAGHHFSQEQLAALKAALPPGQAISPKDMPGKVRQELQALIYADKLPSDVLESWRDLDPADKVAYVIEGLRRAVLEDKAPIWRFSRAAEHIGRAIKAGVPLAEDGWRPRGSGTVTAISAAPSAPKSYATAPWYKPWVLNAGAKFERDGDLFQERLEIQYRDERAVDYDEAQRIHRRDGFTAAMDYLWAHRLAKETG